MLKVEFLYYNKSACRRCASTEMSVKLTLSELREALKDAKMKINFVERKLPKSRIHLSPSILVNGRDVEKIVNKNSNVKSNACSDCCKLAGGPVNCRTFTYMGKKYDYIPKGMIVDAIAITVRQRLSALPRRAPMHPE